MFLAVKNNEINEWINKFKQNWKNKNIEEVLNLFTEDVDYYETPTQKLEPEELRKEWETVKQQEDISLDLEIFSSTEHKHTVQWELTYTQDGERTEMEGVYLIKLNSNGKCHEFWQYCQNE